MIKSNLRIHYNMNEAESTVRNLITLDYINYMCISFLLLYRILRQVILSLVDFHIQQFTSCQNIIITK